MVKAQVRTKEQERLHKRRQRYRKAMRHARRCKVCGGPIGKNHYGDIYFVAAAEPKPGVLGYLSSIKGIKIGIARDQRKRQGHLQTAQPWHELFLLGKRPGCYGEEQALHERFKDQCIGYEWFKPTDELWRLILECAEHA